MFFSVNINFAYQPLKRLENREKKNCQQIRNRIELMRVAFQKIKRKY